jgi:hypothetical protein
MPIVRNDGPQVAGNQSGLPRDPIIQVPTQRWRLVRLAWSGCGRRGQRAGPGSGRRGSRPGPGGAAVATD